MNALLDSEDYDGSAMKYLSASFDSLPTDISSYYFHIKGENTLGTLSGFILVNTVMAKIYPEKNIDWTQVPTSYLCAFLLEKFSKITLPFVQEPMSLKINTVCLGKSADIRYPVVNSDIGELFIDEIKGKFQWMNISEKKLGAIADFYWGYSQISLSLLKSALQGDILLIKTISPMLVIGQKKWMKFEWKGENSVELNEMFDPDEAALDDLIQLQQENLDDHNDVTSPTLVHDNSVNLQSISTIPVTVSFLLASKTLLIEQIEALAPGDKIELPENAYQHIIVKVNGISVASGELVKVGDNFAVEIKRSFSAQE
ncbi:FliM/FliN family flagellar motor switch protein [Proteus penneri]|uniref:Type III secretion system protein SpaO n=1 Tax=Proteus penneri TaxID=102862 RepID=A0A0G4QDA4_9GAMM|nr:FliM/FliN family flagellar motor switch protein [Proteus penneri]CRL63850.1 type III secretion system protein SpaO [Proteus penneri]